MAQGNMNYESKRITRVKMYRLYRYTYTQDKTRKNKRARK